MAIFEGACERVFGRTFALQSYPEYLGRCAVPWVRGPRISSCPPPSSPPQDVDLSSWVLGALSPVSSPPPPGLSSPGGALAIRTRSGWL